jgi:hypothetical protein
MKKWNEEATAWSRDMSARYGNKRTACRYLAFLEDPADRPLLEYALSSTERNQNWDMELRITADRALAIHDGVAEDFKSFRRKPLEDDPKHYLLGAIELEIRLPERPAEKGQVCQMCTLPATVNRLIPPTTA